MLPIKYEMGDGIPGALQSLQLFHGTQIQGFDVVITDVQFSQILTKKFF